MQVRLNLKFLKILLALSSPVFQAEFFGLAKDKSDKVLVQDATKDAIETMIDDVYLKKVDQLHKIVNLAEKYQMKSLMRKVVNHHSHFNLPWLICFLGLMRYQDHCFFAVPPS